MQIPYIRKNHPVCSGWFLIFKTRLPQQCQNAIKGNMMYQFGVQINLRGGRLILDKEKIFPLLFWAFVLVFTAGYSKEYR
jgi:hypothetical protein